MCVPVATIRLSTQTSEWLDIWMWSVIYNYSRHHASSSVRRALADGSFRKLEITPRVSDALEHAEESALEVYNISDEE